MTFRKPTIRNSAVLLFAALLAAPLVLPQDASAKIGFARVGKIGRGPAMRHGPAGTVIRGPGKVVDRAPVKTVSRGPVRDPGRGRDGGGGGGGLIGVGTGIAITQPPGGGLPPPGGFVPPGASGPAGGSPPNGPNQNANAGGGGGGSSGVPPAGERRFVPDEVVIEIPNSVSAATITAMARRHRLERLGSQPVALLNTTFYRWHIPNQRSVATVIRALEADGRVASAQPNYLYRLQQAQPAEANAAPAGAAGATAGSASASPREGDPAQYAVPKMRLPEAHGIAKGDNVLVAVIDSGVDQSQPELAGAIAGSFDTLKPPFTPHAHGTAIAALIAGHSRLMGSAPSARILAVHAFDPAGSTAEATTFNILKGLDWSVAQHARIINMSFAGPADPAIHRALEAAHKKDVVLIAAAGNAGAKSPPLYPAADPNVIAVTATDSSDQLFDGSNRGRHIAVAAPGVDILIAVPNGGYEVSTGTSYSAAEVSGIAALMLQRKGDLTPDAVRDTLLATAKDLGKKGRDDDFGAGLADAYRAVTELPGSRVSDAVPAK